MYKELNQRQKLVLSKLLLGREYAMSHIATFFVDSRPSPATISRDVRDLRDAGFLEQTGERKSARYTLTVFGAAFSPIDAQQYCAVDVDNRIGSTRYQFDLFSRFPISLFSDQDVIDLENTTKNYIERSHGASDTIRKKELERFVIELSWKSSKIEGNTYTLLDTELLLKEGIEAKGHSKEEAIMIINHKNAFNYAIGNKDQYKSVGVRQIEDMHRFLVEGLDVSFGLRSRSVGITGSLYTPLTIATQIDEALQELCRAVERMTTPYDKALLMLVGISYIQPFEDGNKRTARLMANALLLAYDCAPLSYRNVNEVSYRENILVFYEKQSIVSMRDMFREQYIFAGEQYLK